MKKSRIIIRKKAVRMKTGLSNSSITRKSNDPANDFPVSVQISPQATGWYEDEIDAWVETRPRGGGEHKAHLEGHYKRGSKDAPQPGAA